MKLFKMKYVFSSNDDDINDVTCMAGVNLMVCFTLFRGRKFQLFFIKVVPINEET